MYSQRLCISLMGEKSHRYSGSYRLFYGFMNSRRRLYSEYSFNSEFMY